MKFPFYDAPNTATITCCHILENGEPILYVSHDEDDGMWQFLCGKAHETDEAKLVSLKSVFDLDNSVGILGGLIVCMVCGCLMVAQILYKCSVKHLVLMFVLFQAEDGIRDSVASRGLGDVYKRQLRCSGAGKDFGQ